MATKKISIYAVMYNDMDYGLQPLIRFTSKEVATEVAEDKAISRLYAGGEAPLLVQEDIITVHETAEDAFVHLGVEPEGSLLTELKAAKAKLTPEEYELIRREILSRT